MAAASFPDGILTPITLGPNPKTFTGTTALTDSLFSYTATVTLPSIVNLFSGFYFAPTIRYGSSQVVCTIPAFWAAPVFAPSIAVADLGSTMLAGYYSQPSWQPSASGATTPLLAGMASHPTVVPSGGSITDTVTLLAAFTAFPTIVSVVTVQTGGTATTVAGLVVNPPTVNGSMGTVVALELGTMVNGTVANLSLRSTGGEMRHAGTAVFGANAARTNASVALEVQSTTQALLLSRMTSAQETALTAANGMIIYNTDIGGTGAVRARVNGAWASL